MKDNNIFEKEPKWETGSDTVSEIRKIQKTIRRRNWKNISISVIMAAALLVVSASWSNISYTLTPQQSTAWAQIGFQLDAQTTVEIDNFSITYDAGTQAKKTYTEGIGTCNGAELDNVLAMKDYTKVTQDVTIKKGNQYDYSFMVKSENAGEGFAFGVTAGDNTTNPVTVTSDWQEVTGSFTATADATEFGFTRSGTGTVLVDEVVLNETVTGPTDHTAMPGGGAYVPEGHINLLSGAISDFSSDAGYSLNGVGVIENDMLKITASGDSNVQTPAIEVVANETYTFSCYAWVQNTVDPLEFNIYFTGAGIDWKDYACTTSITSDTEGWTLLTCEVKPTKNDTMHFGLRNYGAGSGTIYVDDLALTKAKKVVEDHTTMENGGNKLPAGATNLISNGNFSAEGDLGNGVTAKNGIASWSAKNTNFYQVGIQATKGHSYKVSYFVQICEASSVSYDMFMSGDGSPTGQWRDMVLNDSATIDNISDSTHSASITGDTSGWELVEYTWTAPADGTAYIGFKSYTSDATATVYLDDLVVYDTNYKAKDHTSMEGGGYYIPLEDAVNLNAVGDLSGNTGWTGSGVTIQDGMASVNASGEYLQTQQFSLTQGHTYTMSAYVWVTNVDSSITFDCFSGGTAAPGGGWTDFGMAQWSDKGATCNRSSSLTGNTYGWELVTLTWTAPATDNCHFGFKIYNGAGTVYIDDVALYDHAVPEFVNVELSYAGSEYANNDFTIFVDNNLTAEEWSTNYPPSKDPIVQAGSVWINDVEYTGVNYFFDTNNKKITLWNVATNSGVNPADITKVEIKAGTKLAFTSNKMAKITKGFIIEKNAYGQWVDPSNTNLGDPATLKFGWFDYYASKTVALNGMPASSGEYVALSGAVRVNGVNYGATFTHNDTSATINFSSGSLQDVLSETEVNTVVIPKDLVLYDGLNAVCHVASDVVFYVQKKQGEWLSWTSEYTYQGGNVLYYDMGTAGAKYVFNNNADATYMGVLAVSGKDEFVMGGQTNASREVTALGDYDVSRTIKGEKYDYTVALYRRGDADKTMDGQLTSLDLVAAKKAVDANEATFGHARYKAADSNTDGEVNEKDAAFMRRVLANGFEIHKTTSKGYSTLGQGVMPIIGYGGPSDDTTKTNQDVAKRSTQGGVDNLLTDEAFSLVKKLGINVFSSQVHEVGGDYETSTRMLKMAEKYGLGVYINNAYLKGSDAAEQLSQQTAKYESFGSFYGYYVADEPGKNEIGNYATQLTTLKNHANIASYFNLKPNWDSTFSGDQYNTYLSNAFGTDAEAVSYDLYLRSKAYLVGGFKLRTADFYKNLAAARTASMNANKPFQAFVQTGANWIDKSTDQVNPSNKLTIQEMYLEANAALAMGAKGIHYFNLIESVKQVEAGDNDSGLITIKGEANNNDGGNYAYYNAAKKINTYVAKIDEVLMNATSKGVITSNNTVTNNISSDCKLSQYGALIGVDNAECMVGCFDYYGKDAYLIVNVSPDEGGIGTPQSITLTFNSNVSYDYTRMDGTTGTGKGASMTETVGAGESVLVVVD